MPVSTVLVVEDNADLQVLVTRALEAEGYAYVVARDGLDALQKANDVPPDVVLLDLGLPRFNGVEVCRRLRRRSNVPIIVLTAWPDETEKVDLLELGVDQYVIKPIGMAELLARIKSVLRRSDPHEPREVRTGRGGGLEIDADNARVLVDGRMVRLTETEWAIFGYMSENPGEVLTDHMILRNVWGQDHAYQIHYVHTYISTLRRKLNDKASDPRYIETVHGKGYHFIGGRHV